LRRQGPSERFGASPPLRFDPFNTYFDLPKLDFDSTHQDPQVYGSLSDEMLTSIGFDAFVANDHVHELHDVMEGLIVPGNAEDQAIASNISSAFEEAQLSTTSGNDEEQSEHEDAVLDDDLELTPEARREMDLILERPNKRARGEGGVEDKECKTPPIP